jgi:hypothetical protein
VNPFRSLWRRQPAAAKATAHPCVDPMVGLHHSVNEALRLRNERAYEQSNTILERLIADLKETTGPAVNDLRAKVLGHVAHNYFMLQDLKLAREFTAKALEESDRVGDSIGCRTYRENLRFLYSQPQAMDEQGIELEIRLLRKLDRAQRLSDQNRLAESNELLDEIADWVSSEAGSPFRSYRGKIYGLMGSNYYFSGEKDLALHFTQAALAECRQCGDEDGIRIYQHNLTIIAPKP